MANQTNTTIERSIFSEIMYRLRENIILILIVVILATGSGLLYSGLQETTYSSTQQVNYVAEYKYDASNLDDPYHPENPKNTNYIQDCIGLMRVYVDTMVDFCTTGKVLDRAEYYYLEYLKVKDEVGFDDFILNVKNGDYDDVYHPENIPGRRYFNTSSVSVSLIKGVEGSDSFLFTIKCISKDRLVSRQMTRIFAMSIDREGRDYFEGVNTYVHELLDSIDDVGAFKNDSTVETLIAFFAIGLVLAVLITYLKTFFDNTAKDKAEIEMMTGISVIAYIEKQEALSTQIDIEEEKRKDEEVENAK